MMNATNTLRLGTRTSNLARWQTDHIVRLLQAAHPTFRFEIVPFVTRGDRVIDKPLPEIGGKGLFTSELEAALRGGEIDLAVHSLKDLPVDDAPGLTIGAIPPRGAVEDVLIAAGFDRLTDLPPHAIVGTSSTRRRAQLLALRPDLNVLPIRGNVETRIAKVIVRREYDATVLAAAGVRRLDLDEYITLHLPLDMMLPAPGQGALAVQCRQDDAATLALLGPVEHGPTRSAVTAERAFLQALGGGCSAPIAALAQVMPAGYLQLQGLIGAEDGSRIIRVELTDRDPQALGEAAARHAREQGAGELLA